MSSKLIDSVCLRVLIWYANVMTLYRLQSVSLISLKSCYIRHWDNEWDAQAIIGRSWNPSLLLSLSFCSCLSTVLSRPLISPQLISSSPLCVSSPLSASWTDLPAFPRLRDGQFQRVQAQLCGSVRWRQVGLSDISMNHTETQFRHVFRPLSHNHD